MKLSSQASIDSWYFREQFSSYQQIKDNGGTAANLVALMTSDTTVGTLPCAEFNGVNSNISYPDVFGLYEFTVVFWMFPFVVDDHVLVDNGNFKVYIRGNLSLIVTSNNSTLAETNANDIKNNVWQRVAIVRRVDGVVSIYVDGVDVTRQSNSGTPLKATSNMYIGTAIDSKTGFSGHLSNFIVYRKLWDAADALADATGYMFAKSNYSLLAYYPLNYLTNSGSSFYDMSGNNNSGTPAKAFTLTNDFLGRANMAFINIDSQRIDCGSDLVSDKVRSVSFLTYINTSGWNGNNGRFFSNGKYEMYMSGNNTINITNNGGVSLVTFSVYQLLGKWLYIVTTSDDANRTSLYVNGVLISTGDGGHLENGSTNFNIGNTTAAGKAFNGYFSEFKVFYRILGADEIVNNYRNYKLLGVC